MTIMHDYTGTHLDRCSVVDDVVELQEDDVPFEEAVRRVSSMWRGVTTQMVFDFVADADNEAQS